MMIQNQSLAAKLKEKREIRQKVKFNDSYFGMSTLTIDFS